MIIVHIIKIQESTSPLNYTLYPENLKIHLNVELN